MSQPNNLEEMQFEIIRTQSLIETLEIAHSCCQYHHDLNVRLSQPMKTYLAELQATVAVSNAKAH